MSAAPAAAPAVSLQEHRSHHRYPLQLEMEYKLLSRGRSLRTGTGATLNISSGGVLFMSDESVPSGSMIELTMSWPFLLEGTCPLRLVMRGQVVRSKGNQVAISTRQHEFRTAGTRAPRKPTPSSRIRSLA